MTRTAPPCLERHTPDKDLDRNPKSSLIGKKRIILPKTGAAGHQGCFRDASANVRMSSATMAMAQIKMGATPPHNERFGIPSFCTGSGTERTNSSRGVASVWRGSEPGRDVNLLKIVAFQAVRGCNTSLDTLRPLEL